MRGKIFVFMLGLGVAFATPGLTDSVTAAQVRDRALNDGTAWSLLESLTSEIGPRPAGIVLCLFLTDPPAFPAAPVPPPATVSEPPAPPTGMRT